MNLRRVPTQPELWCSEDGQVFRQWDTEMRPLKAHRLKNGYLSVSTTFDGKHKTLYVHRLTCLAHHGQPPAPNSIVLHHDGDQQNNHKDNLRWGTHKDNQQDKRRHGRSYAGERNPAARLNKLTAFAAKEAVSMGVPRKTVAQRYGVTVHTIGALARGDSWQEDLCGVASDVLNGDGRQAEASTAVAAVAP